MQIDRKTRRALIDLMQPYLTADRREALVRGAFWGDSILDAVGWEGDAATFTANLMNTVLMHGALDDGEEPLPVLLDEFRLHVPPQDRAHVDSLLQALGDAAPLPAAEIETAPATPKPNLPLTLEIDRSQTAHPETTADLPMSDIDYFDLAAEQVTNKDYPAALTSYQAAIAEGDEPGYAYYQMGVIYEIQRDYHAALDAYTQSLRLEPARRTYTRRGVVQMLLGDHAAAHTDFAVATAPGEDRDPNAFFYRAVLFFDVQDYKAAIADLTQALILKPNYAAAYRERGLCKAMLDDHEEALVDFTEAVRLNPRDAEAHYYRGNAQFALARYARAVEDYSRALDLDDKDARYPYRRGKASFRMEDYGAVIPDMRDALELDDTNADAHFLLALCLMQYAEDYAAALPHLERAKQLDPANNDIEAGLKIAREHLD